MDDITYRLTTWCIRITYASIQTRWRFSDGLSHRKRQSYEAAILWCCSWIEHPHGTSRTFLWLRNTVHTNTTVCLSFEIHKHLENQVCSLSVPNVTFGLLVFHLKEIQ